MPAMGGNRMAIRPRKRSPQPQPMMVVSSVLIEGELGLNRLADRIDSVGCDCRHVRNSVA